METLNKLRKQQFTKYNKHMKQLLFIPGLILLMVACNKKGGDNKMAELENLKKQQTELQAKIATLEM
jgi:hypothetical protein